MQLGLDNAVRRADRTESATVRRQYSDKDGLFKIHKLAASLLQAASPMPSPFPGPLPNSLFASECMIYT